MRPKLIFKNKLDKNVFITNVLLLLLFISLVIIASSLFATSYINAGRKNFIEINNALNLIKTMDLDNTIGSGFTQAQLQQELNVSSFDEGYLLVTYQIVAIVLFSLSFIVSTSFIVTNIVLKVKKLVSIKDHWKQVKGILTYYRKKFKRKGKKRK